MVTIIIFRFRNWTAGLRMGRPVLELEKVFNWDKTYIAYIVISAVIGGVKV